MEIIPAIIPKNLSDIQEKVSLVNGLVPLVQIDICDGKFAPSVSWPYWKGRYSDDFQKILKEEDGLPFWQEMDFELDLMVSNPVEVVEDWILAGASTLVIHAESLKEGDFEAIRNKTEGKVKLGIALNPSTGTGDILPYLEDIDFVQFMGNDKIGFNGVELDERIYDKIREFHNNHPEYDIAVDIGVNLETAEMLIKEGVTRLVSGSAVFESDNIVEAIEEFKNLA